MPGRLSLAGANLESSLNGSLSFMIMDFQVSWSLSVWRKDMKCKYMLMFSTRTQLISSLSTTRVTSSVLCSNDVPWVESPNGSVKTNLSLSTTYFTHWGLNKMANILLTTFSNAFSWEKMIVFWFPIQPSLFLGVKWTINQCGFR